MTDALTDESLLDPDPGPAAFGAVYRTYASQVLGYLTARGAEDPEAAMQDVFLAVLPRLNTVTGGSNGLRTFIFSVAHARMVDDRRRHGRAPAKVPFDPELDRREDLHGMAAPGQSDEPAEQDRPYYQEGLGNGSRGKWHSRPLR